MKTSRISNALSLALLPSLLAFGGMLHAENNEKQKDQKAVEKDKTRTGRAAQRQDGPPARANRRQPAKPRQPAADPVTFLGVAAQPVGEAVRAQLDLPKGTGIAVGDVLKDSPAEKAGIKQFDVLTKLDDQILISGEQLQTLVHMKKPGDQITLTLLRSSKEKTVKVKLASHQFPARAAVPRDFPVPHMDKRFGPPGRWDRSSWESDWKKFGDALGKGVKEWMETHGEEWEETFREFLEENLGDPETWEPKMKKWLEEEVEPQFKMHVRKFANVHATIVDEDGKVEITMKDGKKHVTATDPDGKVVFEGFCETDAERKKVPKVILKKVDSVKVDVKFDDLEELKKSLPKPKKPAVPSPKKSGGKKDDAV